MAEPHPSSKGLLQVTDPAAIPEEPAPELMYRHRAPIVDSARQLWGHREIIYTLAERDFRAQYKQAVLGVLWAVLSPVATLALLVIVFSHIRKFGSQGIPYPLFAFVGILCWTFFSSTLNLGGNSLLVNKLLLEKTQFPRECFPLETMLLTGWNTTVSCLPLAVLFIINGRAPHVETVWVPLFIVIEVAFAAGAALGVSGLIIQMRDLAQVLPVVLPLGLFATPVIWPFSDIPRSFQLLYSFVNPVGPVIDNIRRTMLLGHAPRWDITLVAALGAATYLTGGYKLFKRYEVNFADIA